MKKLIYLFILIFISTLSTHSIKAQGFPYHLYDPRTISELVDMNNTQVKTLKPGNTKQIMISAKPFYSAIRLEYTGKSRSLSKEKISLFKVWQESLEIDPRLINMLDKEFLFKECDKEYWIPVQKPAADDFPKDLKSGDKMTVYLMMVGGIEDKGNWDFIFFTNSFKVY